MSGICFMSADNRPCYLHVIDEKEAALKNCIRPLRSMYVITAALLFTAFALSLWGPTVQAATPAGISGLRVSGNTIVNGSGQPVRLLGVDRPGTEYQCIHGNGIFDGPNDITSVQAIASWHTNAVRVPLNEDCWLGINGAPAAFSGTAYQQAITSYVNMLNANNLVAIVDLHWTAPGGNQSNAQMQMADADHAPAFWTSVAGTFKTNSSVVFDLFNEPYNISWQCWRDGGNCAGVSYAVAGMQSLVNAVRSTGATNVLMLGGLAWSNDLSQWLANKPTDPLGNIAAAWHVYNFNACSNTACYDSQIAPILQQVPVIAGEIGENDCAHSFIDTLMPWLDAHGGSYIGWAWGTFDCASFPGLISNYNGTPTNFGISVRDHLAALSAMTAPATQPMTKSAGVTTVPGATVVPQPTRKSNAATPTSGTGTQPAVTVIVPTSTSAPPATATVAPPTRTPTIAATATPAATVTSGAGDGATTLTASGGTTSGSSVWWGEEDLSLAIQKPLTALRVVVTVQKTPGINYAGEYTIFLGGAMTMSHADTDTTVVYTYTLNPGQTIAPGTRYVIGAQHGGNGTAHSTTGDTYTVNATANGMTTTLSGHF